MCECASAAQNICVDVVRYVELILVRTLLELSLLLVFHSHPAVYVFVTYLHQSLCCDDALWSNFKLRPACKQNISEANKS